MKIIPYKNTLYANIKSGRVYKVLQIANEATQRPEDFPITVVYECLSSCRIWCLPLDRWTDKMLQLEGLPRSV